MVEITQKMIERRAFEISLTRESRTPEENWRRAERELLAEAALGGSAVGSADAAGGKS